MSKTKIYGFNNGGGGLDAFQAMAITEDGRVIAEHICSSDCHIPHYLGMDGVSDWKHDIYDKECPNGWEVEFVPYSEIENHAGLQKAIILANTRNDPQK